MVVMHPQPGGGGVGALDLRAVGKRVVETLIDDVAIDGATHAQAESSEHRLLWATPPLSKPLHLSGWARLTVTMSCDKPATNLSAWLVSLPWTGSRRINDDVITRGWADPRNAASLEKEKPLVPGKEVVVTFDLQPDDQIIPAGERIALMIFASDKDFTLWPAKGTKLSIDLDGTLLELPVVGGRAAVEAAFEAAK
jgi:X-Pro dipeptidyl-peptidase